MSGTEPAAVENPFVGPRHIGSGETLYGRDRELTALTRQVFLDRIVLLYSKSGAGKTSLLEAGLRQRLLEQDVTVSGTVRPASLVSEGAQPDPVEAVVRACLGPGDAGALIAEFGDRASELGRRVAEEIRTSLGSPVCLLLDQSEELFTADVGGSVGLTRFFEFLGHLLANDHVWCVIAMREEYIAELDQYAHLLPRRLSSRRRLTGLRIEQARDAVAGPIRATGVHIDDDAADRIVERLSRTIVTSKGPAGSSADVEPVLLQVDCRRIWDRLVPNEGDRITRDMVDQTGSPSDGLRQFYDDVVASVATQAGHPERLLRTFIGERLIVPPGHRAQVSAGAAPEYTSALRRLVDAYLLSEAGGRGTVWFELAHDQLVDAVIRSNRDWFTSRATEVDDAAERWNEQGRTDDYLISGGRLKVAEDQLSAREDPDPLTVDFLRASKHHQRRQRRRNKNIVLGFVVSLVMIVALGVLAYLANEARKEALEQQELKEAALIRADRSQADAEANAAEAVAERERADARALAFQAKSQSDPAAALALALEAVATSPDVQEAKDSLAAATTAAYSERLRPEVAATSGDGFSYELVAWSPAGPARLALATTGGRVHLRDSNSSTDERVLRESGPPLSQLGWSPSGRYVFAVDTQDGVTVWNTDDDEVTSLAGGPTVAWSSDDALAVSTSLGLAIWSDGRTQVLRLPENDEPVDAGSASALLELNWSRDGAALLARAGDTLTMLRQQPNRTDGYVRSTIQVRTDGSLTSTTMSANGRTLAVGYTNGMIDVFDEGVRVRELQVGGNVERIVFSGSEPLWAITFDGLTEQHEVWALEDAASPDRVLALSRSTSYFSGVYAPPDPEYVVAFGDDTRQVLSRAGVPVARLPDTGYVRDVVWSPDSQRFAVIGFQSAWFYAKTGVPLGSASLDSVSGELAVLWALDSQQAIVRSSGTNFAIWRDADGENVEYYSSGTLGLQNAGWNAASDRFATLDQDGALKIWNGGANEQRRRGSAAVDVFWYRNDGYFYVAQRDGDVVAFNRNADEVQRWATDSDVPLVGITVSPDGLVAIDERGVLYMNRGSTGSLPRLAATTFQPESVRWADGKIIVSGAAGELAILDADGSTAYATNTTVAFASVSPGSERVLEVDHGGRVTVRDLADIGADPVVVGQVLTIVDRVSWQRDGSAALIDTASGSFRAVLNTGDFDLVPDVARNDIQLSAFDPDTGQTAYFDSLGRLMLDRNGGGPIVLLDSADDSFAGGGQALSWSPVRNRLIVVRGSSVYIWGDVSLPPLELSTRSSSSSPSIAWGESGEQALVDTGRVHFINLALDRPAITPVDIAPGTQDADSHAMSEDTVVTIDDRGAAEMLRIDGSTVGERLVDGSVSITALDWSKDGGELAVGAGQGGVWVVDEDWQVDELTSRLEEVDTVAWSEDGALEVGDIVSGGYLRPDYSQRIALSAAQQEPQSPQAAPDSGFWLSGESIVIERRNGRIVGIRERDGALRDLSNVPDDEFEWFIGDGDSAFAAQTVTGETWVFDLDVEPVGAQRLDEVGVDWISWSPTSRAFISVDQDQPRVTVAVVGSGMVSVVDVDPEIAGRVRVGWLGDELAMVRSARETAVAIDTNGNVVDTLDTRSFGSIQDIDLRPGTSSALVRVPDLYIMWDPLSSSVTEILAEPGPVFSMGWSPAGRRFAFVREGSDGFEFVVFDAAGEVLGDGAFFGSDPGISSPLWLDDETLLYLADSELRVLGPEGEQIVELDRKVEDVSSLRLIREADRIVLRDLRGSDFEVDVRGLATLEMNESAVPFMEPDTGTVLLQERSGSIGLWRVVRGQQILDNPRSVRTSSLDRAGHRLWVLYTDGQSAIFERASESTERLAAPSELSAVSWVGDFEALLGFDDGRVFHANLRPSRPALTEVDRSSSEPIVAFEVAPDGVVVAAMIEDGSISLLTSSGRMIADGIATGSQAVSSALWDPSSARVAVSNAGGSTVVVDRSGRVLSTEIRSGVLAWSSTGNFLVSVPRDGRVTFWDRDGIQLGDVFHVDVTPTAVALSSRGLLAIGAEDGSIQVFRAPSYDDLCAEVAREIPNQRWEQLVGVAVSDRLACREPQTTVAVALPVVSVSTVRL